MREELLKLQKVLKVDILKPARVRMKCLLILIY